MKKSLRNIKRAKDWSGSALYHPRTSMFSKKTAIGKVRRASLAQAYKRSRRTGKTLDQLRRGY